MPSPDFHVKYINKQFTYSDFPGWPEDVPHRGKGIMAMVESVVARHNIQDNFKLLVRIADAPWEKPEGGPAPDRSLSLALHRTSYSFCVYNEMYHLAFPDFIYVGMPESGMSDYTETVNSFKDTTPETTKVGWCGSLFGDHTPRPAFHRMSLQYPDMFEARVLGLDLLNLTNWTKYNEHMSYQNQIDRWKYLIDMEGCGWSGRFKVLMSTPRIVFMVDRPYQEWYFGHLEPWKHFVPVKRDLSDLIENYNKIEQNSELQNYIKENQRQFAKTYLTREAAENRIYEIIQEMIQYYKEHPTEL